MPWEKQFDREETLGRVMDQFWLHGYEATSIQNLVECTGLNRASLYATFGDKRSLFLTALKMYDERVRQRLLADLAVRYEPLEAIRQLFLTFVEGVYEIDGNRGCFLTNTALELAPHDKEVGKIVANSQEQIEAFFFRMIKLGKAQGSISEDVKPGQAARGLLASLIGLFVLTRSRPDGRLLKSILEDVIRRLE